MKESTQLILYGVFAFFAYRLLGSKKTYVEPKPITPSDDIPISGHDTPRPDSQWTLIYSTINSSNVVWEYRRPYQWTAKGEVMEWEDFFVIGNKTHTSFVSSSSARTTIDIRGSSAEVFFNAGEAIDYLNRISSSPTGGPSLAPPTDEADTTPSWQPKKGFGFGSASPPAQGW